MGAPVLLDLEFFRDAFPQIQLPDSWVIPTSKSDDVIWNIVAAYLNSFHLSDENELTERVKCLAGDLAVQENFKLSIEMCNPFLNRDACFTDKDISNLVARFKERVEYYINNDEKLFETPAKNFGYLEASSKLLSCNIVFISFPIQGKFLVNVFPVQTPPNPRRCYPNHISVFNALKSTSSNGSRQDQFSFCIPKDIGLEKKKQALRKILKCTKMIDNEGEIIQKVSGLPDITENFLMSLLKNNFLRVIRLIYQSPYVLSKLSDAGFETDPRTKDSEGKSAFFHALKTGESHLVSLLYDHAANSCLQTDVPVIAENLLCLKEFLKLLGKDLESAEISEKSRCLFRDLCRFNEFQIEIFESIDKISIKYYDQTGEEYEALQRKETMLTILKTYETYFDYINVGLEPYLDAVDKIKIIFKEFCEHRDYFDKLDFTSAVMLFDHLFLLKERLKLPNTEYLDVESNFFLFAFFRKFFEQYEKQERFYSVSRWITFQKRLSLQSRLCSFKKILENTELSENNIIDKLPKADVRTLTNLPQIYGQFLIFRLQYYLNAATELTVKDLKSILVIERCLQVLGEFFRETDFNSVQRILTLALPSNFITNLKRIHNRLAHIKSHELHYRNNLEENMELFKEIRKDLIQIKKLLLPIYSFHKYEMDQFLLLHSVKSACESRRLERKENRGDENKLQSISPSSAMEENQYLIPTYSCFMKWKHFLRAEINHLNRNGTILDKKSSSGYKCLVENLMLAIIKVLETLKVPVPEKAIEELDNRFWCLESILTYLTKDQKLAEYRRPLVLMLKGRKSLFKELRENAHHFQNINKPTDSVTDRSLDEENETVGKHLSSEPADIHYKRKQFNVLNYGVSASSRNEIQADHDISGKSSKMYIFQNIHGKTLMKTNVTEEWKEVSDLYKNVEKPEAIIEIEKVVLPSGKVFIMTPRDDWLLANVYYGYSDNSKVEVPAEVTDVKRNTFIEVAEKFLDDYKKITSALFQKFRVVSNENFYFESIENYRLMLEGKKFLNARDKNLILRSVSKKSQLGSEHLRLYRQNELNREIKRGLEDESADIVKSTRDYFDDLVMMLEGKETDESELELICKNVEMSDDAKKILFNSSQTQNVKKQTKQEISGQNRKFQDNRFEFLRNRIKMLKNILIEENNAIQQLWEGATTLQKKMQLKKEIVQLYLKDSEIQASIEMLLFDFMTVLGSKELKQLWKKATNLFSGINLRRVLFSDQPLLKSLGRILEPYEITSELVEKMLNLISDEYVMDCMQQILEQSGNDFSVFMRIMNAEKSKKFKNLRDKILEWNNWEEYALLIPSR